MTGTIVVVGASHAAVQAIDTCIARVMTARSSWSATSEPPYNRPPLSKKYFTGELARARLQLRSGQFYQQGAISMRLGLRATAIDRAAQRLRLSDGELAWDKLLLCVGSRARLDVPGAELPGIHYLRTIADVDAIRASSRRAQAGCRRRGLHRAGGRGLGAPPRARSHRARSRGPADAARGLPCALGVLPRAARARGRADPLQRRGERFYRRDPGAERRMRRTGVPGGRGDCGCRHRA